MVLRMIDLFAGSGAFTYAFEQTGNVSCVFANDIVPASKINYDTNFSHPLKLQDINTINVQDIPPHDILTGGFPCQPFSIAGNRGGFDDERSNVFWKIIEIIKFHNPKCVILENVKNIVGHDNGNTFKTIMQHLEEECGYHLTSNILDTVEITGIPQHRERIYIVAIKDRMVYDNFNLTFPKVAKIPIENVLTTDDVPSKYYYTERSSTWALVSENVVKRNTIYQYRRVYVRENKNDVCPTLTANMGTGGHNVPIILDDKGIRKLTPRECFNFQGFPSTYILNHKISDTQLYKLAGNAVSAPVVKLIADRLVPLLIE
jgi:DNA (cytosine-5)-methyltransferase 1